MCTAFPTSSNQCSTDYLRPDDISHSKDDKPSKPPKNFQFPSKMLGNKDRKCQYVWLEKWEWLEYSIKLDACYCFVCFWFRGDLSSQLTSPKGWSSWKDSDRLQKHRDGKKHENASQLYIEYKSRLLTAHQIGTIIWSANTAEIQENREYVTAICDVLLLCARQNLPLRGHQESADSLNRGNFLEIISLLGKYNNTIGDKLKYSPKNAIYTSPDIQNELLSIMATKIQQEIVLDVLSAGFFCVMSDESKDCAKTEQLVISLRYVDQSSFQIRERTICIIPLYALHAEAITNRIICAVESLGLSFKNCLGYSFDGASVMAGVQNGVAVKLRQATGNKCMAYVHCFAHSLNLALISACLKFDEISNYFDVLTELYKFFSSSVCISILRESQKTLYQNVNGNTRDYITELSDDDTDSSDSNSDNPIQNTPHELNEVTPLYRRKYISLKAFCTTRWHYRYRSSASVKLTLRALVESLITLCGDNNNERSAKARALLSRWDLEFLFVNESLSSVLGHCYILNKLLQAQDIEFAEAMRLLYLLKSTLNDAKNMFSDYWEKANEVNN